MQEVSRLYFEGSIIHIVNNPELSDDPIEGIHFDVIKIMEKKFEGLHVDWNRKFIRNSFIGE